MFLSESVRLLLAARAATDPHAARLLEMFAKADEILSERSPEKIGDVESAQTRASALGIAVVRSRLRSLPRGRNMFTSATNSAWAEGTRSPCNIPSIFDHQAAPLRLFVTLLVIM
jgi:hypothetical protein